MLKIFRKRIMRLDRIKIQEEFKKHPPKSNKMFKKLTFFIKHNRYEQPIVVDENNVLVDGYTTYLLEKITNKEYVVVERG